MSLFVSSGPWALLMMGLAAWAAACSDSRKEAVTGDLSASPVDGEVGDADEAPGKGAIESATADERAGIERSNCEGTPPLLGATTRITLNHQGRDREYLVYYPQSYNSSEPTPVLLNFHGTDGSASGQAQLSEMNDVADEKGVIVVYPEGLPLEGTKVFDAGLRDFSCEPRDDIDFARAIIDHIAESSCVNRRRVYSTGMSNGGRMSYRMACHASNWIAAIAPVSGSLSMEDEECDHRRAVPTIHFHGTEDEVAPYSAPGGLSLRSVPDLFDTWSEWTGCKDAPEETFSVGNTSCVTRDECTTGAQVSLCSTTGGGHCWFGNPECYLGDSTTDISASAHMLDFLLKFELPLGLSSLSEEAPSLPAVDSSCGAAIGGAPDD